MANVKITELTAATALAGTDVLPIVDVGADATKKVSVSDLLRNLPDGTASAPALAFADDQNTGVLSPGNNSLAFATSGTQRLVIDSSGNVGIGTTSPSSLLHLESASSPKLLLVDTTNSCTLKAYAQNSNAHLGTESNHDFIFDTNNTERMRIDSSGNIKQSVASGANNGFTVNNGTNDLFAFGTGGFAVNGGTATDGGIRAYNNLVFGTGSSSLERMRIDSSGKVGIGTTSPTDKLNISSSTNQIGLDTGNQSTYGTLDVGHFTNGAFIGTQAGSNTQSNVLRLGTGGSEKVRIDSSGNVGIGTTTPTTKLNVEYGALEAATLHELILNANYGTTNNGGGRIGITFSGNPDGTAGAGQKTAGVYGVSTDSTQFTRSMGLVFNTSATDANSAERMRIDSSGRLLVGATSARSKFFNNSSTYSGKLQVEGTSESTRVASLVHNTSNANFPIFVLGKSRGTSAGSHTVVQSGDGLGSLSFQGADGSELVEAASIKSEVDGTSGSNDMPGRLVFSTTADGSSSPTERMRIDSSGNVGITNSAYLGFNGAGDETHSIQYDSGIDGVEIRGQNGIKFATASGSGTERMRINSSGTLMIGGTAPIDSVVYLSVQGASNADAAEIKVRTNGKNAIKFRNASNSTVGSITVNASATAYNESSDHRLKENVVDITDGITRVKQLQPRRFNFIVEPQATIDGFVAHEAQTVVPEAVTGTHNEVDDDGNPVMQQIDKSKLVPLLTAALQEAIAKIETLETKVAALEAQ